MSGPEQAVTTHEPVVQSSAAAIDHIIELPALVPVENPEAPAPIIQAVAIKVESEEPKDSPLAHRDGAPIVVAATTTETEPALPVTTVKPEDDSSSDWDSSADEAAPAPVQQKKKPQRAGGEESEEEEAFAPPAVQNEILVPPVESVDAEKLKELVKTHKPERAGTVSHTVEDVLVVQAITVHTGVLDISSVLFLQDLTILGKIEEVFGPVAHPMYTVRFPSTQQLNAAMREGKIKKEDAVFYVSGMASVVMPSEVLTKGSDASVADYQEPREDQLDFSDDEEETRFRAQLKQHRRERRAEADTADAHVSDSEPDSTDAAEGVLPGQKRSRPGSKTGPASDTLYEPLQRPSGNEPQGGPSRPGPVRRGGGNAGRGRGAPSQPPQRAAHAAPNQYGAQGGWPGSGPVSGPPPGSFPAPHMRGPPVPYAQPHYGYPAAVPGYTAPPVPGYSSHPYVYAYPPPPSASHPHQLQQQQQQPIWPPAPPASSFYVPPPSLAQVASGELFSAPPPRLPTQPAARAPSGTGMYPHGALPSRQ